MTRPPLLRAIAAALALAVSTACTAAPYVPDSDEHVLERLPARSAAASRALKRLQQAAVPGDAGGAVALADAHYRLWRSTGDPRALGHAQAALAPWWNDAGAPTDVLVLRAALLQSSHAFDRALADLDRALAREPRQRQALLMRATIHTVQGRYPQARDDCARLAGLAPAFYVTACAAAVASLTGHSAPAIGALERAIAGLPASDTGGRAWGASLLGEIAHRRGDPRAGQHFRSALAADPGDLYTLAAYSDWLLDHGRAAEVIELLRDQGRVDALLLRLALAQKALARPEAGTTIAELRTRFAALRARGDVVHRREEARFALEIDGDARTAVRLARENWRVQREPADVRILAEAAAAAGDAGATALVREWLSATGLEDRAVAAAVGTPRKDGT
ncbi:MAG TPA: hypothetical protein VFX05_07520 [Casimicrobiaceae bacterium]|nr:hypothetical protein [Casimicrobiaceae bacterium]